MVNESRMAEVSLDKLSDIDQVVNGQLVAVPFYNNTTTVRNASVTLFAFDALGTNIREIFVSFYLVLDAAATFTPTWHKTRAGDLVTFTQEVIPALATIALPAANRVYSYQLGELAQGLQGEFRIAQDNLGNATNVIDAWALVLMKP